MPTKWRVYYKTKREKPISKWKKNNVQWVSKNLWNWDESETKQKATTKVPDYQKTLAKETL